MKNHVGVDGALHTARAVFGGGPNALPVCGRLRLLPTQRSQGRRGIWNSFEGTNLVIRADNTFEDTVRYARPGCLKPRSSQNVNGKKTKVRETRIDGAGSFVYGISWAHDTFFYQEHRARCWGFEPASHSQHHASMGRRLPIEWLLRRRTPTAATPQIAMMPAHRFNSDR